MAQDASRSLLEELPAHGRWVQKLARSLTRDEASAEDLAQEAQLAALRRGASVRGALGPWLARVTRNFARRNWRTEARRLARERAVARPEALPGVDESAARLEIQRRLVDELAALEPAVRHVLVRRYFDGWTAARIARETGEPAATVRWRLQRGLAELRGRLDRQSGGDGLQWRLALLPVCGRATPWEALADALRPPALAGTIQGALTMQATSQALAAGLVAAAVGVGVWWSVSREEAPRAQAAVEEDAPLVAAPEPIGGPVEPELAGETKREPVDAVAPSPVAEETVRTAAPEARLEGRCLDTGFAPVAGARITQFNTDTAASVLSASDGSFSLAGTGDWRGVCAVRVEAAGFATRFVEANLPDAQVTQLGDVVLQPGGRVRGRVQDAQGAPFASADVTVTPPDLWQSIEEARRQGPRDGSSLSGTSGPDGRFEIDGASVGPVRVWAGAKDMRYAISPPTEVRAGESTEEVVLVLEPLDVGDRITGFVLTPESEPVPSWTVNVMERSSRSMSSLRARTDENGRFEILAKPGNVYDLSIRARDEQWSGVSLEGVRPGTQDVELRFEEARSVEVRVSTSTGEAIEDFELTAEMDDVYSHSILSSAMSERHAGGRALLRIPTEPFTVCVDARGFERSERGPFTPDELPATLEVELVPEPGVRGRVLAAGQPLAGAKVTLHEAPAGAQIEVNTYQSLRMPRPEDTTTTDDEGLFTLKLREPGTYFVRAEADGYAAADVGPLELEPKAGRTDLELALGPGGALEGQVLTAPGLGAEGVIVAMNRGDGFPRTIRSDLEGRFRFEGLTPGPWHLLRGQMEVNSRGGGTSFSGTSEPVVIPFNCTIREGETTRQDLDLRAFAPCELRGVLLVNGAPAKDWGVSAWPGAKESMGGSPPSTAVAADGSFALSIEEAGRLRLSLSPPAELGCEGRIDVRMEVRPGENRWREDLVLGRISGRCLSPVRPDEQSLFYRSAKGVIPSCWLTILPDEQGSFVLPFVPVGKGSVQRLSESGGWSTVLEIEVPGDGERIIELP